VRPEAGELGIATGDQPLAGIIVSANFGAPMQVCVVLR
jgi:hypothetical protein